ncbi:hypothetical protein KR018_010974 [Drosophila ironensis]|nr:hypothetical protein KR018_010974 [Drosophila ironensis]
MCRRAVRDWLVLITMEKYVWRFLERGFDSIASCKQIVLGDLLRLGVTDAFHRNLLLAGVQFLINSPERFVCLEPCELHNSPIQEVDLAPIQHPDIQNVIKDDEESENDRENEPPVPPAMPKPVMKCRIPVYFRVEEPDDIPPEVPHPPLEVETTIIYLEKPQPISRLFSDSDDNTTEEDESKKDGDVSKVDVKIDEDITLIILN